MAGGWMQGGWRCARLIVGVVGVVGLLFCSGVAAPGASPAPRSVAAAEALIAALNATDADGMVALAAIPFELREQEWVSASNGSGFVLGAAQDRTVAEPAELARTFRALVERVHVRSATAAASAPGRQALLSEQLSGAAAAWKNLDLVLFLRGEGDVEHVVIVGVAPGPARVRALYLN